MFANLNYLNRGKEVTITILGSLRESVGIGAHINLIAKIGELSVPVPNFDMNLCNVPILGVGNNKCPISKGETRLGYRTAIPAIAPTVCLPCLD